MGGNKESRSYFFKDEAKVRIIRAIILGHGALLLTTGGINSVFQIIHDHGGFDQLNADLKNSQLEFSWVPTPKFITSSQSQKDCLSRRSSRERGD